MAKIFHIHSTQLDAWHSNSGKWSFPIRVAATSDPVVVSSALAGVFGGYLIDYRAASRRGLGYTGDENWTSTANFTALMRIVPTWTGFPGAAQPLFQVTDGAGLPSGGIQISLTTAGKFLISARDSWEGVCVSAVSTTATWSGTANTPADIWITWDGTSSAGAFKIYIDGVIFESITPSAALATSRNNNRTTTISLGYAGSVATGVAYYLNEFCVWDSIETPVAGRTDFIAGAAFDGLDYTTLTVDKVKTGEAYNAAGVAYTGTYDGSDRWTDIAASKVELAYDYKANSTVNNRTGTLSAAATAAAIADAVWDELTSGHTTSGTFGALMQKALTVGKFLGLK
jgi:hypothetical protein